MSSMAPLWQLCERGDLEGVVEALAQGASPNSRLLEGSSERPLFQTSRDSEFTDLWTPALSFAAREGHVEIVRELLAHKDINVNASDFQMETALHSVMVPFMNERHLEVVRMLLSMGKKLTCVNSLDGYGSNAVKYAVLYGFKEVVEEFVKCDLVKLTYYETLGGHELVGLEVLAERWHQEDIASMLSKAKVERKLKWNRRSLTERAAEVVVDNLDKVLAKNVEKIVQKNEVVEENLDKVLKSNMDKIVIENEVSVDNMGKEISVETLAREDLVPWWRLLPRKKMSSASWNCLRPFYLSYKINF